MLQVACRWVAVMPKIMLNDKISETNSNVTVTILCPRALCMCQTFGSGEQTRKVWERGRANMDVIHGGLGGRAAINYWQLRSALGVSVFLPRVADCLARISWPITKALRNVIWISDLLETTQRAKTQFVKQLVYFMCMGFCFFLPSPSMFFFHKECFCPHLQSTE